MSGVAHYNAAIDLCVQLKDGGTRDLFESILVESEEHVDWLEQQLNLIGQVGLQNYLQSQMGEAEAALAPARRVTRGAPVCREDETHVAALPQAQNTGGPECRRDRTHLAASATGTKR